MVEYQIPWLYVFGYIISNFRKGGDIQGSRDAVGNLGRGYMNRVFLSGTHDIADDHLIGQGKGFHKSIQMPRRAGEGEWLKNGPNPLISHPLGSAEGGADLGWMMGVIIGDGYARQRSPKTQNAVLHRESLPNPRQSVPP